MQSDLQFNHHIAQCCHDGQWSNIQTEKSKEVGKALVEKLSPQPTVSDLLSGMVTSHKVCWFRESVFRNACSEICLANHLWFQLPRCTPSHLTTVLTLQDR